MAQKVIDPQDLYRNVVHVLERGLRTSTYKLATMTALVDFSIRNKPGIASSGLEVPLAQLARRVMELYWDQLRPFEGAQLRQSTQPRPRIFEAIESLRSAADCPDEDPTIEMAAKLAPGVFRRVLDEVAVRLAQQPLQRLQLGSAPSLRFLFDDSFLHDNVTRAELARHRYVIQLNPGVAQGLASQAERLNHVIRKIWADDVLRINKMAPDQRARLEQHLFGDALTPFPPERLPASSGKHPPDVRSSTQRDESVSSSLFATRLNSLIAASPDYSSGLVAAQIRQTGFPMTVSTLTRLQAGIGPAPSLKTIRALARHFGVEPAYFVEQSDSQTDAVQIAPPTRTDSNPAAARQAKISPSAITPEPIASLEPVKYGSASGSVGGNETWAQAVNDDIDEIAALCEIQDDGCWIGQMNKTVRCRVRGDSREPLDLPKLGLHRWAWMVDNGCSEVSIPSHLIQIRRSCGTKACFNPQHLYAATPGGYERLTKDRVARILRNPHLLSGTPTPAKEQGLVSPADTAARPARLVLDANIALIRSYCTLDRSGCWLAPHASPVACRAKADARADDDLPMLAFHRWVWMVVHGHSAMPLPGNMFHVRRRCGKEKCCRPEHLFLTTPQGHELTPDEADALLRAQAKQKQKAVIDPRVGQHREAHRLNIPAVTESTGSRGLFSSRLNQLFEKNKRSDGLPYTSGEVAQALQEDGLAISESLIERLRSPVGVAPNTQITEALAYFFDVDPGYFSAATDSALADDDIPARGGQATEVAVAGGAGTSSAPSVAISRQDLGRVIIGLSETIGECLARNPAQSQSANRLLALLTEIGALLMGPQDGMVISRLLLWQIVGEWGSVARDAKHQSAIARLSRLANGN